MWLLQKLGIGVMPAGLNFKHIVGAGFITGIVFTMLIFISELAFS